MDDTDSLQEGDRSNVGLVVRQMITIDFSYVTSTWVGRVKLLELIIITLAGCILPSVIGVFFTRFSFFTFVIWTSFMYIIIDLVLHLTGLWRRLPRLCHMSDIWIYPVLIGALAFLISSSLVLSTAHIFTGSSKSRVIVSGLFGIIAFLLFLAEAFFHYKLSKEDVNDVEQMQEGVQGRRTISMPITRQGEPPSYAASTLNAAQPIGSY